jgi:hypothetical protein
MFMTLFDSLVLRNVYEVVLSNQLRVTQYEVVIGSGVWCEM